MATTLIESPMMLTNRIVSVRLLGVKVPVRLRMHSPPIHWQALAKLVASKSRPATTKVAVNSSPRGLSRFACETVSCVRSGSRGHQKPAIPAKAIANPSSCRNRELAIIGQRRINSQRHRMDRLADRLEVLHLGAHRQPIRSRKVRHGE